MLARCLLLTTSRWINIARWDSEEHWRAAVASAGWEASGNTPEDAPVRAQPALYRVVHVTPDPQASHA